MVLMVTKMDLPVLYRRRRVTAWHHGWEGGSEVSVGGAIGAKPGRRGQLSPRMGVWQAGRHVVTRGRVVGVGVGSRRVTDPLGRLSVVLDRHTGVSGVRHVSQARRRGVEWSPGGWGATRGGAWDIITAFRVNIARQTRGHGARSILCGAAPRTSSRGEALSLVSLCLASQQTSVITFQTDLVLVLVIMRMTVIILTVLILTIYKAPASLSWRLHLPGLGVLSNSSPVAVKLCSHIRLSLVLVLDLN